MDRSMRHALAGCYCVAGAAILAIIGIVAIAATQAHAPPVTLARLASPANGVLVINAVERFDTVPECVKRRNEFPKPDRAELECVVGR